MKKSLHVLLVFAALCLLGSDFIQAQQIQNLKLHDFIIGGKNVRTDDFISSVTVGLMNVQSSSLCTATLLSETTALTAAHCVVGRAEDLRVVFGLKLKGVVKQVERVATPSSWSDQQENEKNTSDIALVKFEAGIPETAMFADLMSSHHQLKNGEVVTLAGFGISKAATQKGHGILRWVVVQIQDAKYSSTEVLLDQTDHKGACHGDSGGPAFIQDSNGELKLWGVTSRGVGDPDDLCIGQSVYTRIDPYLGWIEATVQAWN